MKFLKPRRMGAMVMLGGAVGLGAIPSSLVAQAVCRDTPEGRVCTTQQSLITPGAVLSVQTQRDLGLVTVGGGCSGTLLNRFWVLTADHCVTTNGQVGGPAQAPGNLPITAAWSKVRVLPSRLVRTWGSSRRDVALIYLGAGDFGVVNVQLLSMSEIEATSTLVKYGRGMSAFATIGPPLTPAVSDGQYRSAIFTVSAVGTTTYTLLANPQVGGGGDSGGPDVLLAPNGIGLGIGGVQSTCVPTGEVNKKPGAATNWTWVTGISSCNSATIEPIRYDIIQIIRQAPLKAPPGLVSLYYLLLGP